MRRRSKPRVVWLPPDVKNRVPGLDELTDADQACQGLAKIFVPGTKGAYEGLIVPVVGDKSNEGTNIIGTAGANSMTLSDMFGSGYRLRRICGHIWPMVDQPVVQGQNTSANFVFTVGFQVMACDSSGVPANGPEGAPDNYATQENPWIWRRSWILTNFAQDAANPAPLSWGIISVANGGLSVKEGSFIDQKTARIVGPDQRLFMCMQVTALDGVDDTAEAAVHIAWNYRVLASLKTNLGNRRNSSR